MMARSGGRQEAIRAPPTNRTYAKLYILNVETRFKINSLLAELKEASKLLGGKFIKTTENQFGLRAAKTACTRLSWKRGLCA